MKRFLLLCVLSALSAGSLFAQVTTVTGQVLDVNGIPYAGAQVKAQLVTTAGSPVTGQPTVTNNSAASCKQAGFGSAPCQIPFQGTFGPTTLDSAGKIPAGGIQLQDNSQVTPASTQWLFTVNEIGNPLPLGTGPQTCSAQITISGGSQSVSSSFSACPALSNSNGGLTQAVGPVINVTASPYSASASLADNVTAFTAAATAANAASLTAGNPTFKQAANASCPAGCASLTPTIPILQGDSVLVFIIGTALGRTITVSDSGSNVYSLVIVQSLSSNSNANIIGYATAPSGAVPATSITVAVSGANEQFVVLVMTASNVGSYRFPVPPVQTGTVTPAITSTTLDTNNILVGVSAWWKAAADAASQASGTLQTTVASTASADGASLVTQASATSASLTDSVTLALLAEAVTVAVELRSRTFVLPTLYIPYGNYNYSGGLSLTQPSTLLCEPGTVLNYIGSAHAVDVGPSTLTVNTLEAATPYIIQGCLFTGGGKMTQGIFIQPWISYVGIRFCTFHNFGNSTAYMVWGQLDNWDVEVGPQNRFIVDDLVPRNLVRMNGAGGGGDQDSYLRFHDNMTVCFPGAAPGLTGGCTAAQTGIGIYTDGSQNRVYHNNMARFNPNVLLGCSAPPCYGNEVGWNQFETVQTGAGLPAIQFSGTQYGIVIHENSSNLHGLAMSLIGPVGGSDALQGARINFNTTVGILAATPLVALNNVANQTGNQSSNNLCGTAVAALAPCPIPHTTGSNISAWNFNIDDALMNIGSPPTVTGTGACATVSTQKGGSLAGLVTCTGTTGASTLIITFGTTAPNGWNCSGTKDETTPANVLNQTSHTATSCTLTASSITANDVILLSALEF